MSVETTTIRPKSLDEIRAALNSWLAASPKPAANPIRFSKPSQSRDRLRVWSRALHDMRLRFTEGVLSCELGRPKVYLLLDDFDVKTEVDANKEVLYEFKLRRVSPRTALKERLNPAENIKQSVFFTRALNALADLERKLPKQRIEEASSAPNDYLVIFRALSAPSVATQLAVMDPLAASKLRGIERQKSLIEGAGGVLTAAQVASILDISRQGVDKRRKQGHLIGLTQGKRGYAYPSFQFQGGKTLKYLEKVLDALREHDPWMQLAFFVNGNERLNGSSPLEMLRSGKLDLVLQAAASYGEQGAA